MGPECILQGAGICAGTIVSWMSEAEAGSSGDRSSWLSILSSRTQL